MLLVELDIFSGRPNPVWALSEKQERQLLDWVLSDPKVMSRADAAPARLGFRGFLLRAPADQAGPWQSARLRSGQALPWIFRINPSAKTGASAPLWLLESSQSRGDELPPCVYDEADRQAREDVLTGESEAGQTVEIDPAQVQIEGAGMCCVSNYLTGTNFGFWNGTYSALHYNNCYNFASNYRVASTSTGFAYPGLQGGRPVTSPSFSNMASALRADTWLDACGATDNIQICFVLWPNTDFHFYRVVAIPYTWGHKPGCTAAKKTDNSGNVITNPETCNRGPYTVFGEYFYAYRARTVKGYGVPSRCL